ncbi:hypothetical protein DZA65_00996 [Dickeya dianthicola]|uniref:Uncharacterized protein n=1 Tax=Dickeya dianthicola TaxID=204039 RepID=A0ABX9NR29_9GAMM|nr:MULTISPECIES: hypothetical protein [Dickeya]MBQ4796713.1 hypothetical protein [Pectobacterium versatile]AYC17901.1 hypothetical protein DZA65_00996 [Dickeya dianthicola]MBI0438112.1 hypothetical protein [Dickeya dianthicola]MBI0448334.1 hypothetical protein [Dickeya dianthicola]MBI0452995.1 hypothetical protein [Dickeya dianthicola]
MLHEAITGKKHVKVTLKVSYCESSNGIEYERVNFYTCNNLDAAALEDAISNIYGCRDMYHFLYDRDFGQGRFITICGCPESGEYDIELA